MIEAVASSGYLDTSIDQVLAGTGLARSTFYDHFADKADCFRAAIESVGLDIDERLALLTAGTGASLEEVIETMVGFADEDTDVARVLFIESLGAGPRSIALRDSLLARLDSILAGALQRATGAGEHIDLPARTLSGAIFRLLAMRLLRRDPQLGTLTAELLAWAESYRTGSAPRWREEYPVPGLRSLSAASVPRLDQAPAQLVGRVRRRDLEQAQRERIVRAVMRCSYERGYSQVTVADITAAAKVSRKAFYKQFPEKVDAALAADELVFQSGMVASAAGFFSAAEWPERAWEGGVGLLSFLAANPEAARFAFVETSAVGHAASALAYERLGAFALFLEEGYRIRPEAERLPRTVSEALMATMFERAYLELRERRDAGGLLETMPSFVYVILAPFMGPEAAGEFVEAKVESLAG
jgi:AcrR family transcriptional regulator